MQGDRLDFYHGALGSRVGQENAGPKRLFSARRLALGLTAWSLLVAGCSGSGRDLELPEPPIVFTHVNVIPMSRDTVLADHAVVIRDGVITALAPMKRFEAPPEARLIQADGAFLLPGLADMHVHVGSGPIGEEGLEPVDSPDQLLAFVVNGVTTVRNMRGRPAELKLRDRIDSGETLGPRFYTAGPVLGATGLGDLGAPVRTAQDVEAAIREQNEAGYDLIVLGGEMPPEVLRRVFAVSVEVGTRIAGHAQSPDDPHDSAALASFEHLRGLTRLVAEGEDFLDSEAFEVLEEWSTPITTTLVGWDAAGFDPAGDEPAAGEDRWKTLSLYVRELSRAGVPLLLGTDAASLAEYGATVHEELQELVAAGLSSYEALRTATVYPAEWLGSGKRRGTIGPNREADLLLLAANPLDDIANTQSILGVMLRGKWHDRAVLDGLVERIGRIPH